MIFIILLMLINLISNFTFSFLKLKSFINPLNLFTIFWIIPYLVSLLYFFDLNVTIIDFIIVVCTIGFSLTFIISYHFQIPKVYSRKTRHFKIKWMKKALIFVNVVANLAFLLIIIPIISHYGFMEFIHLSSSVRYNYYVNHLHTSSILIIIAMYLSAAGVFYLGFLSSEKEPMKLYHYLLFLPNILFTVLFGRRQGLAFLFVMFIIILYSKKDTSPHNKKNQKRMKKNIYSIILILLFVFLILYTYINRGYVNNSNSSFYEILNRQVQYFVSSFKALSSALDPMSSINHMFGVNTFLPIFKVTNFLKITNIDQILIIQIESGRNPVYIPFAYNVFTVIYDTYLDFGIIGTFVFFEIISYISAIEYKVNSSVRNDNIFYHKLIYTFITLQIVFLAAYSVFSFSSLWYIFIFIYFIYFVSKKEELQ